MRLKRVSDKARLPYAVPVELALYLSTAAIEVHFVAVVSALNGRAVNLELAVVVAYPTIVIVQRTMRDKPTCAV
ncbi:MAG: hypothetical protein ACM3SP_07390 [Chloroflexota bacterium]